ncbi:MAG: FAD:protein FMN transferase [Halanaerobiales bacterium]
MKKNYEFLKIIIILLVSSLLALSACGKKDVDLSEIPQESGTTFVMNTLVQMKVYGDNADDVIDRSFNKLNEIEKNMSKTIEESDIYSINQNAGDFVSIEQDTFEVIEKALYYARLTEGRFDPSIGSLVELWGIGTNKARVPVEGEIAEAQSLVNYNWVELNPDQKSVRLKKEGMRLDLGAIAKGYAADEVRNILREEGIDSAYINMGGNVLVVGGKPDNNPWRIGIQDPRHNRGNTMAIVEVKDKTVVTSGNYERYFEKNGVIYHHIVDPTTGYPARSGLLSVSIVSDDSFDADALSTSLFILGPEKGLELVNKLEGVEALFIKKDHGIIITDGIKDKVEITDDDFYISGK